MAGSTALEERLAHLERLADDLSDVVARQAGEIEALQRRVEMLLRREAEREDRQDTPITRPPHY